MGSKCITHTIGVPAPVMVEVAPDVIRGLRPEAGTEGLLLVRDVLCERRSVEAFARLRGAHNDRERRHWSWLFRRCLSVLAVQFGFANLTRPPPRPAGLHPFNGDGAVDPALDRARHAGADELADLSLRRGKPNGQ